MAEYACGVEERYSSRLEAIEAKSRLQTNRPLVYVRDSLPGWSLEKTIDAYLLGVGRWSKVADVKWRVITDLAEAGPMDVVNVITTYDQFPQGVLADQQLPNGSSRRLLMRMNARLKWILTDGPMTGGMDAARVFLHEAGHFIDHSHWPRGAPPEVMEPFISDEIWTPQPTEAAVTAGWFGQPTNEPDPQPTPTPGPNPCPTICQGVSTALGFYNRIRRSGGITVPTLNITITNEQLNAMAASAAGLPCEKITAAILALLGVCPTQPTARACAGLSGIITLIQTLGPLVKPCADQLCPKATEPT